jgi:TonB family protein
MLLLVVSLYNAAHARGPVVKEQETAPDEMVVRPVRLAVDPIKVELDGVQVASTPALDYDAVTERIGPLILALAAHQTDWNVRNPSLPFAKELVFAVDDAVSYRVVRKLMFSVAQAHYIVRFASNGITLPLGERGPHERTAVVGVWIKGDGYVFAADDLRPIAKKAGHYDLEALRGVLVAQKKLEPEIRWIVVVPDDAVRFHDVAPVMSVAARTGIASIQLVAESPPTTLRDRMSIHESLSKAKIRQIIGASMPDVRACYVQYLARVAPRGEPEEEGKIDVTFTVEATGTVGGASVTKSTLRDAEIQDCVLAVMRSLEFPLVEGGGVVVVRYPFVFNPREPVPHP